MIVVNVLMAIIMLLVIPFCMGLVLVGRLESNSRTIGLVLPAGYLVGLVTFEIVTVPILLTTRYQNFKYVVIIYTPIMLALAAYGVYSEYKRIKSSGTNATFLVDSLKGYRAKDVDSRIIWILVLLIMIAIIVMAETRVIFDGDDAYYVTQSLITQQNGTMYATQPYTGRAADVDIRHAMAVFTMWISYIGKLTGIHTTIVCHTVLPLVIIPLTFLTFMELGYRLFGDKRVMLPYFVLFMELLYVFGRISIYTSETFLLTRTWQGKAMAANFLIPMTFVTLIIMFGTKGKNRFLMPVLINAVAGIFSSLAIVLVSILILVGGFVLSVREKRIKTFIASGLCCIPGAIYMLLYLYFTYFGWR